MKKKILLLVSAVCFSVSLLMAQDRMQRQTPEERTKATIEKMAPLNLDEATRAKTEPIIAEFYNAQQKAIQEMRESGTNDRDAMMAKRRELAVARDAKLKLIFSQEQMKKWIEDIEPSLRPQRPGN